MLTITAAVLLAGPAARLPQDTTLARRAMREARAYAGRDAASLWSIPLSTPLLIADPATRRAVSGVADSAGLMAREGTLYAALLAPSVGLANTSLRWGDRTWAMVLTPLPEDSVERGILLMHEIWHSVQAGAGIPLSTPDNPHLATASGRTWLKIEGRALDSALATSGASQRRAIADAFAARQLRRASFPGSDTTERQLELTEGLAEYTGIVLVVAPSGRAAVVRARLSGLEREGSLVRSFPYATGTAWALLLDTVDPGWRGRLRPGSDLASLAAAAVGLDTTTSSADETRFVPYALDQVRSAETTRDEAGRARQDSLRARYVTGPTLRLPLAEMNMSFNPNAVEPLAGVGTVYRPFRLSDRWGVLDADSSGALVNASFSEVRVAAPGPGGGSGAGWRLTLNAGWEVVPAERAGDYTIRKR